MDWKTDNCQAIQHFPSLFQVSCKGNSRTASDLWVAATTTLVIASGQKKKKKKNGSLHNA